MNIFNLFELILLISLAYVCFIDDDCNSHGICNDGTCNCDSDWNVKPDCSGNINYDTIILGDAPIPHIISIFGSFVKSRYAKVTSVRLF